MKYLIFYGAMLLLLTSCSDEKKEEIEIAIKTEYEANRVTAKLGEVDWSGEVEMNLYSIDDTLVVIGIGDDENLGFTLEFRGEGVYSANEIRSFYTTKLGGDVVLSWYEENVNSSSYVIIEAYDAEQNRISGQFDLQMIKKYSNPETEVNNLHFTDGCFDGVFSIRDWER